MHEIITSHTEKVHTNFIFCWKFIFQNSTLKINWWLRIQTLCKMQLKDMKPCDHLFLTCSDGDEGMVSFFSIH